MWSPAAAVRPTRRRPCWSPASRSPAIGEYLLDEALFTTPAHPHWSGAALIGPQGDLIGLGSLRVEQRGPRGRPTALNMSVPAERLAPIYEELVRGRPTEIPRPWLGVFSQVLEERLVVLGVSPGGPAAKAEMRRGDLILALNGRKLEDLTGFYRDLWNLGPRRCGADAHPGS